MLTIRHVTSEPQAKRVLVVDDDFAIRMPVSAALEEEGFVVTQASDGYAAIAACLRSAPDVIVLELALPHLDGAGFADEYRKLPASNAPIIVVSGAPRAAETAARVRASVFLSKPFSLRELLKEVRRLTELDALVGEPRRPGR